MLIKLNVHGRRWLAAILSLALVFATMFAGGGGVISAAAVKDAAIGVADSSEETDFSEGLEPSFRLKMDQGEVDDSNGLKADIAPVPEADEKVNIIVELEGEPLLARFSPQTLQLQAKSVQNRQAALQNEHEQAKQRIAGLTGGQGAIGLHSKSAAAGLEVLYEYFTVINGLSLQAEYQQVEDIAKLDGVKKVWVATTYEQVKPISGSSPMLASSSEMLGAPQAYELGLTGKGRSVAVIDTGLDWKHEAFLTNMPPQLTLKHSRSQIGDLLSMNEMSAGAVQLAEVYINDKVPFGYDYADKDTNVIPSRSNPDNIHGTHVAGIVAGNGGEIKGIAPDAQLFIMKVFDDVNGFTSDAIILAALDDAVKLGADVINMSLGANAGFSEEGEESKAAMYSRIADAGIELVVSAGNGYSSAYKNQSGLNLPFADEPDNAIIADPSTYSAALSVASVQNTILSKQPYLLAGERKILFDDSSSESDPKLQELEGTYSYVYGGFGAEEEMNALGDMADKIALISRGGGISFFDKLLNAYISGAKAVVIFNDESTSTSMDIPSYYIPAVFISKEDGEYLLSLETKQLTVGAGQYTSAPNPDAGLMSDFSSWGPAPDLKLKPEITAPGDPVYSAVPDNGYENLSGTSMAAPNAAGAAILIKEYVLDTLGAEGSAAEISRWVQSLMMSTARPIKDEEGQYYSPRKQGAGMVDIQAALQAGAYLSVEHSERPKAELGDHADGQFQFTFTVHNLSDTLKSYTLNTAALSENIISENGQLLFAQHSKDYVGNGVDVYYTGDDDGTVTVAPKGEATVTVTLILSDTFKQQLDSMAMNGTFIDGFVFLTEADHKQLSLPFLGFYGDWSQPALFDKAVYDEEDYSARASYPYNRHTGANYLLGQNFIAVANDEPEEIEPDKFVISPKGYYKTARIIGTATSLLRNAESLTYRVRDAQGNIVKETAYSHIRKSYFSYTQFGYAEAFMAKPPYFDGLDQNEEEVPEGRYTYEVSGAVAGIGGRESDTWSFQFAYDKTAPFLDHYEIYKDGDKTHLKMTITDNHYVSGLQLTTKVGIALSPLTTIKRADSVEPDGSTAVIVDLDITDALQKIKDRNLPEDKMYVDLFDYGMNYRQAEIILEHVQAERVTLDQQELSLVVGTTKDLQAVIEPEHATDKKLTWTSSDSSIARVDDQGSVTGVAEGSATITVSTVDGKTATSRVTVVPIGELGIVLEREQLQLDKGASRQLKASVNEQIASGVIEWASSNVNVVTVDADGLVVAIEEGTANVTASIAGKVATVSITVVAPTDPDFVVRDGVLVAYDGSGGHIIIPDYVKEIGEDVFSYREDIITVKTGPNLRKIGERAFLENIELRRIEFSNGLEEIGAEAFKDAAKLTEILLPDSVTTIGQRAFSSATALSKVRLPEGLTRIENGVFDSAVSLESVVIPDSVIEIGDSSFYYTLALKELRLPTNLKVIGNRAFASSALEEVIIPNQVDVIGDEAFVGNPLYKLELGTGVETIGNRAFAYTDLEEVIIPDNVIRVGDSAFSQMDRLTRVKLGAGVVELGNQAFHHETQSALRSIEVDARNKAYKSIDGILFNYDETTLLRYPSGSARDSYIVPDGVKLISDNAFHAASNLIEVKFPDTLLEIGNYAFNSARGLRSLTLSDSVQKVGKSAFAHANQLETVVLGAGVEELGDYAFAYNEKLNTIHLASVKRIGAYTFQYNSSLVEITFPDSVEALGANVLSNNQRLTTVNIGAGMTQLGKDPFASSLYIREINVNPSNPAYLSEDGVLFNKAKTNLIIFPMAARVSAYTVPATVEKISNYAFQAALFLERVDLPEGLKEIGISAFNRAERLRVIKLPDSLESLGAFSFSSTGIEEVILGKKLNQIDDWAFSFLPSLKKVSILGEHASVGSFAFIDTPALSEVVIGQGVEAFGWAVFDSEITIYGWENSAAHEYAENNGHVFKTYSPVILKVSIHTNGTVSGTAEGGIGEKQYRFRVKPLAAEQAVVKQDYSAQHTFNTTSLPAGKYTLYVDAKDEYGVSDTYQTAIEVSPSAVYGNSGAVVVSDSQKGNNAEATPIQIVDAAGQVLETISKVEEKNGLVALTLASSELDAVFNKTKADIGGIRTVRLMLPAMEQAETLELTVPASYGAAGDGKKRISISTSWGTIEISDQMLTSEQAGAAANLTFTLGAVDKQAWSTALQTRIGNRPALELHVKADGKQVAWENKAAPVRVEIPYTPAAGELERLEQLGVVHIDDKDNASLVTSARYDHVAGTIRFATTHFSSFAVVFTEKSFEDLGTYAWASKQIETLAAKGILNGTSQHTFSPAASITRADYITMLVRTLGLQAEVGRPFADVASTSYYYEAVGIAKELGIALGSGDNQFYPQRLLSRQDMMVLTERALRVASRLQSTVSAAKLQQFTDRDQIAAYAADSIAALVQEGLIQGTNNRVNPLLMTTRAEAAVFLYRIYNME